MRGPLSAGQPSFEPWHEVTRHKPCARRPAGPKQIGSLASGRRQSSALTPFAVAKSSPSAIIPAVETHRRIVVRGCGGGALTRQILTHVAHRGVRPSHRPARRSSGCAVRLAIAYPHRGIALAARHRRGTDFDALASDVCAPRSAWMTTFSSPSRRGPDARTEPPVRCCPIWLARRSQVAGPRPDVAGEGAMDSIPCPTEVRPSPTP